MLIKNIFGDVIYLFAQIFIFLNFFYTDRGDILKK